MLRKLSFCPLCPLSSLTWRTAFGGFEGSRAVGLRSIVAVRHDFATSPRDQGGQGAEVHAGLQKMHRAVSEHGAGPARVKTVDLLLVAAVEGTRARARLGS